MQNALDKRYFDFVRSNLKDCIAELEQEAALTREIAMEFCRKWFKMVKSERLLSYDIEERDTCIVFKVDFSFGAKLSTNIPLGEAI